MKARLFTDGGARGNPGPAAYGYVLEAEDGTVLAAEGEAIGTATNNIAEYSGLVATVFENFRYTDEWRDGRTTILFFEANVGDRDLQGIDILEENEAGQIEKLTVMVRPLSGLQALAGTMAARLGLA